MFTKTNQFKTFMWMGVDVNGFRIRGEAIVSSIESLSQELQREKIHLLSAKPKSNLLFRLRNSLRSRHVTQFCRELATLIRAGIPLVSALEMMRQNQINLYFRELLLSIKLEIEKGKQLSQALKQQNFYFDEMLCNLISAGEQSGTLEIVLNYLADYREKIESLKRQLKRAFCYPIVVLSVSILVTILMLTLVIPRFAALFNNFGAQLPLLTIVVIHIANGVRHFGMEFFCCAIIGLAYFKWQLKRSELLGNVVDKFILKIPILGNILRQIILARCMQTLSLLLKAGLPIAAALQTTAKVAHHRLYYREFMKMSQQVTLGNTLNASFTENALFPNRVQQFIAIGEESGTLDNMLSQLANYFTERVDHAVAMLNQMLEPLLMIVLCVIIGGLVIAMYLPIFRLGSII
jgi:type IV pilus assembly protein PilC